MVCVFVFFLFILFFFFSYNYRSVSSAIKQKKYFHRPRSGVPSTNLVNTHTLFSCEMKSSHDRLFGVLAVEYFLHKEEKHKHERCTETNKEEEEKKK